MITTINAKTPQGEKGTERSIDPLSPTTTGPGTEAREMPTYSEVACLNRPALEKPCGCTDKFGKLYRGQCKTCRFFTKPIGSVGLGVGGRVEGSLPPPQRERGEPVSRHLCRMRQCVERDGWTKSKWFMRGAGTPILYWRTCQRPSELIPSPAVMKHHFDDVRRSGMKMCIVCEGIRWVCCKAPAIETIQSSRRHRTVECTNCDIITQKARNQYLPMDAEWQEDCGCQCNEFKGRSWGLNTVEDRGSIEKVSKWLNLCPGAPVRAEKKTVVQDEVVKDKQVKQAESPAGTSSNTWNDVRRPSPGKPSPGKPSPGKASAKHPAKTTKKAGRKQTPKKTSGKVVFREPLHRHICDKCGLRYEHEHPHRGEHVQRPFECPNESCVWYFKAGGSKKNVTHAQLKEFEGGSKTANPATAPVAPEKKKEIKPNAGSEPGKRMLTDAATNLWVIQQTGIQCPPIAVVKNSVKADDWYVHRNGRSVVLFGVGSYTYSETKFCARPKPEWLTTLEGDIVARLVEYAVDFDERCFDTALLNHYPPQVSIPLHCDDEKEIDQSRPIISFSFGCATRFSVVNKANKTISTFLHPGDIAIMEPGFQYDWKHTAEGPVSERFSVTWRSMRDEEEEGGDFVSGGKLDAALSVIKEEDETGWASEFDDESPADEINIDTPYERDIAGVPEPTEESCVFDITPVEGRRPGCDGTKCERETQVVEGLFGTGRTPLEVDEMRDPGSLRGRVEVAGVGLAAEDTVEQQGDKGDAELDIGASVGPGLRQRAQLWLMHTLQHGCRKVLGAVGFDGFNQPGFEEHIAEVQERQVRYVPRVGLSPMQAPHSTNIIDDHAGLVHTRDYRQPSGSAQRADLAPINAHSNPNVAGQARAGGLFAESPNSGREPSAHERVPVEQGLDGRSWIRRRIDACKSLLYEQASSGSSVPDRQGVNPPTSRESVEETPELAKHRKLVSETGALFTIRAGKKTLPPNWSSELTSFLKNESAFNPRTHTELKVLQKKAIDWLAGFDLEGMGITEPETFKTCVEEHVRIAMLDIEAATKMNDAMFDASHALSYINGFLKKGNVFGYLLPGWLLILLWLTLWVGSTYSAYNFMSIIWIPLDYYITSVVRKGLVLTAAFVLDFIIWVSVVSFGGFVGWLVSHIGGSRSWQWHLPHGAWVFARQDSWLLRRAPLFQRTRKCGKTKRHLEWELGLVACPVEVGCEGCDVCGRVPKRKGRLGGFVDAVRPLAPVKRDWSSEQTYHKCSCTASAQVALCDQSGRFLPGERLGFCSNLPDTVEDSVTRTGRTYDIWQRCDDWGRPIRVEVEVNGVARYPTPEEAILPTEFVSRHCDVMLLGKWHDLTWLRNRGVGLAIPDIGQAWVFIGILTAVIVYCMSGVGSLTGFVDELYNTVDMNRLERLARGMAGQPSPWDWVESIGYGDWAKEKLGLTFVHVDSWVERMSTMQHVVLCVFTGWSAVLEVWGLKMASLVVRPVGAPN